jgi:hypothetical protein
MRCPSNIKETEFASIQRGVPGQDLDLDTHPRLDIDLPGGQLYLASYV